MKTVIALFISMSFFSTAFANASEDQCQYTQYRQQRNIVDQQIEDLYVKRALTEDSNMAEQLTLKIETLYNERSDLVNSHIACWSKN